MKNYLKLILPKKSTGISVIFYVLLIAVSVINNKLVYADGFLLNVDAGSMKRKNCVLSIPLPEKVKVTDKLSLTRMDNQKQIPIQIDQTASKPKLVWLVKELNKNEKIQYQLTISSKDPFSPPSIEVKDDGKHLNVSFGIQKILSYNHALVKSPIPNAPYYERSGYIHPVYNLEGQMITDDFNPDHAHQHGIMFSWRKMKFQGRITETWDQRSQLGKIEHVQIDSYRGGPVFGFFKVKLRHVDLSVPSGSETMLNETWVVKIYAIDDQFLFDLESIQECASGGMTIRGAASWFDHQSYDYLTSEGKTKKDGNHTRPEWVEMAGPLEGKYSGVTLFSHKENFRSPQPVRLHPKMPYFCFPPSVFESFEIVPGKPYRSRYRFHVHTGKANTETARWVFNGYVNPPEIELSKN